MPASSPASTPTRLEPGRDSAFRLLHRLDQLTAHPAAGARNRNADL